MSEPIPADLLESLWRHADQHWDNPAAHRALLEQCNSPRQLQELARRYRVALDQDGREQVAKAQLGAIATIAMAQLEGRPEAPAASNHGRYLLVAFFLISSAILYWFL